MLIAYTCIDLGYFGFEDHVNSNSKMIAKYPLAYDVSLSLRIVICVFCWHLHNKYVYPSHHTIVMPNVWIEGETISLVWCCHCLVHGEINCVLDKLPDCWSLFIVIVV